jgi:hypothetical protein
MGFPWLIEGVAAKDDRPTLGLGLGRVRSPKQTVFKRSIWEVRDNQLYQGVGFGRGAGVDE